MAEEVEGLSSRVIGAAIEVHRHLGPGLLERAYEEAMQEELSLRGIAFESQLSIPAFYKGRELTTPFRVDFLIEGALVLELKAVERVHAVHIAQTLTYLKLGNFEEGLLLNFEVELMRDGIRRLFKPRPRANP